MPHVHRPRPGNAPPHGESDLPALIGLLLVLLPLIVMAVCIWRAERPRLRACPLCSARAVRALVSEELGPDKRHIRLQCGQCGVWRTTIGDDAELERHERAVERDRTRAQRLDARRLRRSRDEFVRALRNEVVGPDDFLARTGAPSVRRRGAA